MKEKKKCHSLTCVYTKVLEIFGGDKLVVVVDGRLRALLQLLGKTVQKGTPARGGAEGLKKKGKGGRGYGNRKVLRSCIYSMKIFHNMTKG